MNTSSTNISTQVNPDYLSYRNTGVLPLFLIHSLILSTIALIGIPLNSSVCYIIIKYRKKYSTLGSNTSILLLFNSFFEILHQSGHFLYLSVALSGKNFIPFGIAIYFNTHSVIGFNSALLMFNCLSFDRLLAATFPI